jgi:hypothetical protein
MSRSEVLGLLSVPLSVAAVRSLAVVHSASEAAAGAREPALAGAWSGSLSTS